MASGGKRGSAGERVLEGRHVIGLFMLMLLFSGVFFTLGYVMGRNQSDALASTSTGSRGFLTPEIQPKSEVAKSSSKKPLPAPQTEPAPPASSDWEFYHAGDSSKTDDRLKPAPNAAAVPVVNRAYGATRAANTSASSKANSAPLTAGGFHLQVAAMTREADAMALANSLRKKNFPTFVQTPQGDKYYHVLVGPYADQKSADAAKKGLEAAGFKAIVKR